MGINASDRSLDSPSGILLLEGFILTENNFLLMVEFIVF